LRSFSKNNWAISKEPFCSNRVLSLRTAKSMQTLGGAQNL
jgi:hypothetical protein